MMLPRLLAPRLDTKRHPGLDWGREIDSSSCYNLETSQKLINLFRKREAVAAASIIIINKYSIDSIHTTPTTWHSGTLLTLFRCLLTLPTLLFVTSCRGRKHLLLPLLQYLPNHRPCERSSSHSSICRSRQQQEQQTIQVISF